MDLDAWSAYSKKEDPVAWSTSSSTLIVFFGGGEEGCSLLNRGLKVDWSKNLPPSQLLRLTFFETSLSLSLALALTHAQTLSCFLSDTRFLSFKFLISSSPLFICRTFFLSLPVLCIPLFLSCSHSLSITSFVSISLSLAFYLFIFILLYIYFSLSILHLPF